MKILAFGTDSSDLGIDQAVGFWTDRLQRHLKHVGCHAHAKKEDAISISSFWLARHAQMSTQTEDMFQLVAGTIHRFVDPEAQSASDLAILFDQLVEDGVPEETLIVVTTSIRAVLAPDQGTGPSIRGHGKRG
ncbi:MAG: hypothetical protein Q8P39_03515 [Candidatus Yanofskybacteria bacterium]|nr:hypothetical protein [Candidatus Yanofskybacteria bacterium]